MDNEGNQKKGFCVILKLKSVLVVNVNWKVGVGRAEKNKYWVPRKYWFSLLLRSERNFPCRTYFTSFFCTALTFGKKWNDEGPTMQWMDDQPHLTIAQDRRAFIPRICGKHDVNNYFHAYLNFYWLQVWTTQLCLATGQGGCSQSPTKAPTLQSTSTGHNV